MCIPLTNKCIQLVKNNSPMTCQMPNFSSQTWYLNLFMLILVNKKQSTEIREATSVYITRHMIFVLPEVLDIVQTLIQFLCGV